MLLAGKKTITAAAVVVLILGHTTIYGSEDSSAEQCHQITGWAEDAYDTLEQSQREDESPWDMDPEEYYREWHSVSSGFFINPEKQTEVRRRGYYLDTGLAYQHGDGPLFTFCFDHFFKGEEREECSCRVWDNERRCESAYLYRDPITGERSDWGADWFAETTCRDSVSGRDHFIIKMADGGTSAETYYNVFSFDPATQDMKIEYVEADCARGEDWEGFEELLGLEGTCTWRDRRAARKTFGGAMDAFRVNQIGDDPVDASSSNLWPIRKISEEVARKWLLALAEIPQLITFEGASYSTESDRANWRVIQVLTEEGCGTPGFVLVQDRRKKEWQAIYASFVPMKNMIVKDDQLFAWVCTVGSGRPWNQNKWHQDYAFFQIDLQPYSEKISAILLVHPTHSTDGLLGGSDLPDLLKKSVNLQGNRKLTDVKDEIR